MIPILISGCTGDNKTLTVEEQDTSISEWELVWTDEFEGEEIDDGKWNKILWRPGWVNNESQAYTDRDTNLFLRDGKLVNRS